MKLPILILKESYGRRLEMIEDTHKFIPYSKSDMRRHRARLKTILKAIEILEGANL